MEIGSQQGRAVVIGGRGVDRFVLGRGVRSGGRRNLLGGLLKGVFGVSELVYPCLVSLSG